MSQAARLPDVLEELLNDVRSHLRKEQKGYEFIAEVASINDLVYGGKQYVSVKDRDDLQLVVPEELCKNLKLGYDYKFKGVFGVGKNLSFGYFQFHVSAVELIGMSADEKKKLLVHNEIIRRDLLHKRNSDFESFKYKSECKVAIVTSEYSKALKDVQAVFRSHPGISYENIKVKLNDVDSIVRGINEASNSGKFDVILIVRGGGNQRDFEVFNDYKTIDAIAQSKIEVITGIGHEGDNTVAELAADKKESTPTKAAQFLVGALGKPRYYYSNQSTQYNPGRFKNYEKKAIKRKPVGCAVFVLISMILIVVYIIIS